MMNFIETKDMIMNLHVLAPHNCLKLLIGNKTDIEDKREVTTIEGQELANLYGFSFYEVSSVGDNKKIDQVFTEIGKSDLIRAFRSAIKS